MLCFSDARIGYKLGNKWGFIDAQERLVIQPIYDQVFPYENGVAVVRQKDKYGLIDPSGKLILSLKYVSIDQSRGNYLLKDVKGCYRDCERIWRYHVADRLSEHHPYWQGFVGGHAGAEGRPDELCGLHETGL